MANCTPIELSEQRVNFLQAVMLPGDVFELRFVETFHDDDNQRRTYLYGSELLDRDDPELAATLDDFDAEMAEANSCFYFGVAPRYCPEEPPYDAFSQQWQIPRINGLWADVDDCQPQAAQQRIKEAGLPEPSIVVSSGNGTHVYWLLNEPYVVRNEAPPPCISKTVETESGKQKTKKFIVVAGREIGENSVAAKQVKQLTPEAEKARSVMRGIAKAIQGGDEKTYDLSRLLRVPGTYNRKFGSTGSLPKLCHMVVFQPSLRYDFAEFEKFAAEPAPTNRVPAAQIRYRDEVEAEQDAGLSEARQRQRRRSRAMARDTPWTRGTTEVRSGRSAGDPGEGSAHDWIPNGFGLDCPVCGHTVDNCKIHKEGEVVLCGRGPKEGFNGENLDWENEGGQVLYRLGRPLDSNSLRPFWEKKLRRAGISISADGQPAESEELRADYTQQHASPSSEAELEGPSRELGVSAKTLRRFGVIYDSENGQLLIPEHDHLDQVIGQAIRVMDSGQKFMQQPSKRGLYLAADWWQPNKPILLPEGMTDTAAMLDDGLVAIGRSAAAPGFAFDSLVEILRPLDNPIWVFADHDTGEKNCGNGVDAAMTLARRLSVELQREVQVWRASDDAKDYRQWRREHPDDEPQFQYICTYPPPEVRPAVVEAEEAPTIEQYRQELCENHRQALEDGHSTFTNAPTGLGKTYAAITAGLDWRREVGRPLLDACGRVIPNSAAAPYPNLLFLTRDHETGDELLRSLYPHGATTAIAFPRRDQETCQNLDEALRAEQLGFSVSAAVCPGCPFNHRRDDGTNDCEYLRLEQSSRSSAELVSTHARFQQNSAAITSRRSAIFVQEDPRAMLAPRDQIDLAAVEDFLRRYSAFLHLVGRIGELSEPRVEFLRTVQNNALMLRDRLSAERQTQPADQFVAVVRPPGGNMEQQLYHYLQGRASEDFQEVAFDIKQYKLFEAVTTGATRPWLQYLPQEANQKRTPPPQIVTIGSTRLGPSKTFHFNDATGEIDILSRMSDTELVDITPPVRPRRQHPITQITLDMTRRQCPLGVAKRLAAVVGYLDREWGEDRFRRMGVICHSTHFRQIFATHLAPHGSDAEIAGASLDKCFAARQLLQRLGIYGAEDESRITMASYFFHGDDRGSNRWLDECDGLLVLGTPRVANDAVYQELMVRGEVEALQRPGNWGDYLWEAYDADGNLVRVKGQGYLDETWRKAHESLVQAALLQATGRCRPFNSDGIPSFVVSNEYLGEPVTLTTKTAEQHIDGDQYGTWLALRRINRTHPAKREDVAQLLGLQPKSAPSRLQDADAAFPELNNGKLGWEIQLPGEEAVVAISWGFSGTRAFSDFSVQQVNIHSVNSSHVGTIFNPPCANWGFVSAQSLSQGTALPEHVC